MTDEGAARMRAFIADNPKGKHGLHLYTPEEYGIDPVVVRRDFGATSIASTWRRSRSADKCAGTRSRFWCCSCTDRHRSLVDVRARRRQERLVGYRCAPIDQRPRPTALPRPHPRRLRPPPPYADDGGPHSSGQAVTLAVHRDVETSPRCRTARRAPRTRRRSASRPTSTPRMSWIGSARALRSWTRDGDLETAHHRQRMTVAKNFHFRSPAASFTALKAAGVDVVDMANNHTLDYGPTGMQDTFATITGAQLPVTRIGAARPSRSTHTARRSRVGASPSRHDRLARTTAGRLVVGDRPQAGLRSHRSRRLLAAVAAVGSEVDTLIVSSLGRRRNVVRVPLGGGSRQRIARRRRRRRVGESHARGSDVGKIGSALVACGLGDFVYWHETADPDAAGSSRWPPPAARSTTLVGSSTHHRRRPVPRPAAAPPLDLAEWSARRSCSGLSP